MRSMDAVEGAVAVLPGLTTLALHHSIRLAFSIADDVDLLRLPRSVTALRHLRRLSLSTYRAGPLAASFPAGPWLAQLHWLGLPWHMTVPAAASLATAVRLQHLCLYVLPPNNFDAPLGVSAVQWAAFWRMLQAHPALRSLRYEVASSQTMLPAAFADGLLELRDRRPGLRIARTECATPYSQEQLNSSQFVAEMLGADDEPSA